MESWKEHNIYRSPCSRGRIEEIVRRCGIKPKEIIDVGCNEGYLSKALIEAGHQVTSVDIDPKFQKLAKDLFGIKVWIGDISNLWEGELIPKTENGFDIAIGSEILEHLDNPGQGLTSLFKVAREKVIISIPIGEYFLGEDSHQWELGGAIIEHDSGQAMEYHKNIFVIEFERRR